MDKSKFSKLKDYNDGETIYFLMNNQLYEGTLIESFYSKGKKFKFFDAHYLSVGTKDWKRSKDQKLLKRSKPLRGHEVYGRTPEEVWAKVLYDSNNR